MSDANFSGALRNCTAGHLRDIERSAPVVCHRTKILEPIGVRHRAEIARVLADFFVITMEVSENGLQLTDDLALERDVHAKHPMGRGMLRPHRHFHQLALEPCAHCRWWSLGWFEGLDRRAHCRCTVIFSAPSSCGRGV